MKHKNPPKNSAYKKSDDISSNIITDEEISEKSPTKKYTSLEIAKLEKQLKMLKEQASKNNDALQYKKQDKKKFVKGGSERCLFEPVGRKTRNG